MRDWICTALGVAGGLAASAFGGWSAGMTTLLVCMSVDYLTGLMVAGIFHASGKTKGGALESRAGWKGLARKVVTMLLVLTAHRLELLAGVSAIRDAAVIGFCANELLSITENAALMGVPLPAPLARGLELLQKETAAGAAVKGPAAPQTPVRAAEADTQPGAAEKGEVFHG